MNISVLLERMETNTDEQNCESFNDSYRKLAMLIGVDAVIKLYTAYGGGYISLPKKLFDDKYIQQYILSEYDGTNARELARSLDFTYSWIRKVIKKSENSQSEAKNVCVESVSAITIK